MARAGASSFSRGIVAAALVAAYACSAGISIYLSRPFGTGAGLWTSAGFLAGIIILVQGPWRIGAAAACVLAHISFRAFSGDLGLQTFLGPLINLGEAILTGYLAIRFCGVRSRRLNLRALILILLGAIVPAAVLGGGVGAAVTAAVEGADFLDRWRDWSIPQALGTASVLPALLLVPRARQYREFRRSAAEVLGLLAGLAAVTGAVFIQDDLPLYFVVFPALTLIAFRLGPPGAAVAGFMVAIIALPMTLLRHGPAMLATGMDMVGRLHLTQVFVTAVLFTGLATAGALADQARLRRLALGRDRAARAARVRARDAERLAGVGLHEVPQDLRERRVRSA